MYQALYRKYRPNNFDEIAGQKVIVQTLKNAISNDRLSHAYLFTGPRGTGKTSIAKIVAKTINCECLNDFIPCNNCKSCTEFNSKNDVDIIEIDAASNNGVDEIREIKNKIDLVPSFSKYKVYIIDEVHMLTTGAFNALLKTLEEPPQHVIFILATTEPHKIPLTILSRCQRFDFKKISIQDIVERLKFISKSENLNVPDEILFEIARLCDGGLRDSVSLLDQVISYANETITINDVHDVNGTITQSDIKLFFDDVINMNYESVFSKIYDYSNDGKNLIKIVENIIDFIKNILLFYEAPGFLKKDQNFTDYYSGYNIDSNVLIECINALNECLNAMKKSNNLELILEMSLINISRMFSPKEFNQKPVMENEKKDSQKTYEIHKQKVGDSKLKEIRVNNTLARFNKMIMKELLDYYDSIKNYIVDNEYGKCASILLDGKLKAASDEYIIIVYDNNEMSKMFNNSLSKIEKLIEKVFLKKYKVVSVSMSEWEEIKDSFNTKKKKYVYTAENGMFDDFYAESSDDEIALLFNEVVVYD